MSMGMGIGTALFKETRIKKANRWIMAIAEQYAEGGRLGATKVVAMAVKTANKPKVEIETEELSFLNEKVVIPKTPKPQSIEVTFMDFQAKEVGSGSSAPLYAWVQACYQFGNPMFSGRMSDAPAKCMRNCHLYELDGEGGLFGIWEYYNCWISKCDWGKVDYSDGKTMSVSCTIQYQNFTHTTLEKTGAWGDGGGTNDMDRHF